MSWRFNPPPGWPAPPPGWVPPPGWNLPPHLPAPPIGWQFWLQAPAPQESAKASGSVTPTIDPAPASAAATKHRHRVLRFWSVGAIGVLLLVGALTAGIVGTATPPTTTPPVSRPTPTDRASPTSQSTSTTSTSAIPTTPAPKPTPSASKSSDPKPGSALALATTLPVKGRAPKTGYSRDQFGVGWRTSGGCDTREKVLRRDISKVTVLAGSRGCTIVGGRFHDPYGGETTTVTPTTISTIDIDHVVALSDAWQKGAQQWTRPRRIAFANDQVELLATSQSLNSAKGDGDTATWLPPNKTFRCAYVARQVTIKAKYRLWVTRAESDAMIRVLTGCPHQKPITAAAAQRMKDPDATVTASKPKPKPKKKPSSGGGGRGTDPRFGTCREANAAGYGPYVRGQDPEYDWYMDRDHDGIDCER